MSVPSVLTLLEVIEIVGDGKYWNHSRTAQNTGNHPDEGMGDGVSSYAWRDIAAGEELKS